MKDRDWRTLTYGISQGNCILVLGPEIPLSDEAPDAGPGDQPLPPQFASQPTTLPEILAEKLCMEVAVTNLDPLNLSQVAEFYSQRYGRNDLEADVVSFYRQAPRSGVYADIAKIPFNIIVSLTHDPGLIAALEQEGRSPVVETYDFRGDQKAFLGIGRDGTGTVEKPLVYNLCGHMDIPRSLVLTESDTLEFLSAVMSKERDLPGDLRSHLRDANTSCLLLGFGLTRWYLRIMLQILNCNKSETRSFALERIRDREQAQLQQTTLYMSRGLRVESFDLEVGQFVGELRRRVEASGLTLQPGARPTGASVANGSPTNGARPTPLAEAPKIFISYASEDEDHAQGLYDSLSASGFDPWLDKQGLRGGDRWDDTIRGALDEVDYVIVMQSAALARKTFSYVNKEIAMALERQQLARRGICYVIPVRVDEGPLLDELKHLQTLDLHRQAGVGELVSVISRDQQRRRKRAA